MSITENVTVQPSKRKQETDEMIRLFQKMTELERAKVFGYAQGVESKVDRSA